MIWKINELRIIDQQCEGTFQMNERWPTEPISSINF